MIGLLFAVVACAAAVDEPTLTATWSTSAIEVGEHARLDVVLRGECAVDAELLALPAVEAATLTLEQGPEYSSTDAYRCNWRIDVLARRAGTVEFVVRVQCQSAEELAVTVPPLTIHGSAVLEPESRFDLTPSAPSAFVGEPFVVDVEIQLGQAAFAAGYELELPWLHDVVLMASDPALDPVMFAVDGQAEPLRLSRAALGDALALRTRLRVSAPQAGRLSFAGSRLRPRVQSGSRPRGDEPRIVTARGGAIEILALPAVDRPPAHVDAVGAWSVRSRADRVDVEVGEPVRVEVVVEAQAGDAGNLDFATLPSTWVIDGCVAAQRDDRREPNARVLTFEVRATRAGALQIAPYEVAAFDPRAQRYVTTRSSPIPLRVSAARTPPAAVIEPGESVWPRLAIVAGGACVVGGLWFALRRARMRRDRVRRADPRFAFEQACSAGPANERLRASKALAHAFAVAIGVDVGALGGGGAKAALRRAGVGDELTRRVAELIEEDEAAAFAAPHARDAAHDAQRLDEARALVEALLRERSS